MRWIGIIAAVVPAVWTAGVGAPAALGDTFAAELQGFEEVPPIFSIGTGRFRVVIGEDLLEFELSYSDLEGSVQEAHIHFGQRGVNGGISVFLCSNLGDAPPGVQGCPEPPATVIGVVAQGDVIGPVEQGIDIDAIESLTEAIRDGVTYVNVHTDVFPGGEIRGQLSAAPEERVVDELLDGLFLQEPPQPEEPPRPGFF